MLFRFFFIYWNNKAVHFWIAFHDVCQWIFIAKVIPRQGRKVTCKRAKSKLVWDFAASMSNLSNGQRWEAQRVAEQWLETGGMMFERSEFLPPQALRQAASGEVWTDWRILQQLMLMQFVNKGSTECRTRLPRFWYFFQKSTERKSWRKIKVNNQGWGLPWNLTTSESEFFAPNFCRWAPLYRPQHPFSQQTVPQGRAKRREIELPTEGDPTTLTPYYI